MEKTRRLLTDSSILYRCSQKYYDKVLDAYQLGSGQLPFLIFIYENEGITMNGLAQLGCYDKGTVTKGVQRLENANGRTIGKTDMYEGDKISASASVDGIDAAMSDADGSVNARVNLNILNSKTFLLPQTGGTGLYAATIIGAIAIGLGFVLTRKKRQRA